MGGEGAQKIESSMRNKYSDLDGRRKWRDGRLAALAIHKMNQPK